MLGCFFRYYVGVLNKATMHMEVHCAELFNMQPVIPGEIEESAKTQDPTQTYREKVQRFV